MPEQIHPLLGSKTSTMTRLATSICSHAYTNRSQTLMAMKRPKTEPKWLKGEQEEARNRDRQKDIKKEKNKENKRVGRKLLPFISRWSPLLPSCRRRRWWRRWKWRRRRRGRRASRTRSSSLSYPLTLTIRPSPSWSIRPKFCRSSLSHPSKGFQFGTDLPKNLIFMLGRW